MTQKSVLAEETTENTSEKTMVKITVTAEPTTEAVTQKPTQKLTEKLTEKPTQKPAEKATEAIKSIKTDSLTSYVSPGEYASISIKGVPNTDYSIQQRSEYSKRTLYKNFRQQRLHKLKMKSWYKNCRRYLPDCDFRRRTEHSREFCRSVNKKIPQVPAPTYGKK